MTIKPLRFAWDSAKAEINLIIARRENPREIRIYWDKVRSMRDSYDFSGGVRSTHVARYAAGVEVVIGGELQSPTSVELAPDVSAVLPDSQSVNEAPRLLIKAAKGAKDLPKAS